MPDLVAHVHTATEPCNVMCPANPNTVKRPSALNLPDGQVLVDGEPHWSSFRWCRHPDCDDTNWQGRDRVHRRGTACPPDQEGAYLDVRASDSPRRSSPVRHDLADEGRRLLAADARRRRQPREQLRGDRYAHDVVSRSTDRLISGTPYLPLVGDSVLYWNSHGFPRAATIIGTADSMVGEQHCQPITAPDRLHLQVLSPLGYARYEMDVPRWDPSDFELDARAGRWSTR